MASSDASRPDTIWMSPRLPRCLSAAGTRPWRISQPALHNILGIAIAKKTYRAYRELIDSPRFGRLANAGARPQRLLWASTGTKDPDASDVLYIKALQAPFTINTMPEATLLDFADHGMIGDLLPADGGDAEATLARFDGGRRRRVRAGASTPARRRRGIRSVLERADGRHRDEERPAGRRALRSAPDRARNCNAHAAARMGRASPRTAISFSRCTSANCSPTIPSAVSAWQHPALGLYFDYSKQRVTSETISLLLALAEACNLRARIDAMFRGDKINVTERRAVLHVALRAPRGASIVVDGENVVPHVHDVLDRMADFSNRVRDGTWTGHTGKRIRNVINIGSFRLRARAFARGGRRLVRSLIFLFQFLVTLGDGALDCPRGTTGPASSSDNRLFLPPLADEILPFLLLSFLRGRRIAAGHPSVYVTVTHDLEIARPSETIAVPWTRRERARCPVRCSSTSRSKTPPATCCLTRSPTSRPRPRTRRASASLTAN